MAARADLSDIIGIGFRLVRHRDEIRAMWDRLAPLIRDGVRAFPEIRDLVDKVVPGLADEVPVPIPPADVAAPDRSVKWLQESLNLLSDADLERDGDYGEMTREAVRAFQAANGLEADGWAGIETCAVIQEQLDAL